MNKDSSSTSVPKFCRLETADAKGQSLESQLGYDVGAHGTGEESAYGVAVKGPTTAHRGSPVGQEEDKPDAAKEDEEQREEKETNAKLEEVKKKKE